MRPRRRCPPAAMLLLAVAAFAACIAAPAPADAAPDAERPRVIRIAPQDAKSLRTYLARIAAEMEQAGRPRLGKRVPWWMSRPLGAGAAHAAPAPAAPAPVDPAPAAAAPAAADPSYFYDWVYQYDE